MTMLKTTALTLSALLLMGGLSACQQAGMEPGTRTGEVRQADPYATDPMHDPQRADTGFGAPAQDQTPTGTGMHTNPEEEQQQQRQNW